MRAYFGASYRNTVLENSFCILRSKILFWNVYSVISQTHLRSYENDGSHFYTSKIVVETIFTVMAELLITYVS